MKYDKRVEFFYPLLVSIKQFEKVIAYFYEKINLTFNVIYWFKRGDTYFAICNLPNPKKYSII